jgi:excisionase family DNA binding protein
MRQIESIRETAGGLLRVPEVAARLAVKPATVRAWLLQRKLPCVRLSARAIRIRQSDVDEVISRGLVGARE